MAKRHHILNEFISFSRKTRFSEKWFQKDQNGKADEATQEDGREEERKSHDLENRQYLCIRKFVCLDAYPETDYELLKEAGVEIISLDKNKITKWAKELVNKYEKSEWENASKFARD